MKVALKDGRRFVFRFDKGEEVMEGMSHFAGEQGISAASFYGIGACQSVELAYYRLPTKDYSKQLFAEELEIISIAGNISQKDGKSIVHCHGQFGRSDFSTVGGHVMRLVVSVTCEIFFTKLEGKIQRQPNSEFNLNLLS